MAKAQWLVIGRWFNPITDNQKTLRTMPHSANRMGHFWGGWGLAVLGAALVVGLTVLPPFVGPGWRVALMQAFDGVCHQLAERSPHWHGVQLAVCDRCFGIYTGLLAGTLSYPLFRRWDATLKRHLAPLLLLAALPAAIDWGGDFVGLWLNTPVSRFVTGGGRSISSSMA